MPIGAIIGAAADIGSSLINRKAVQDTNRAQMQLSQYSYQKDEEMWNKSNIYNQALWEQQNAYNSPAAQMQRSTDAGINPNLMFGQGSSTGNAGAMPGGSQLPQFNMPQLQAPTVDLPNILGQLGQYQDIRQKKTQNNILDENLIQEKINSEWLWEEYRAKNQDILTGTKVKEGQTWRDKLDLGAYTGNDKSTYDWQGWNELDRASPYFKRSQASVVAAENKNKQDALLIKLLEKGGHAGGNAFLNWMIQNGLLDQGEELIKQAPGNFRRNAASMGEKLTPKFDFKPGKSLRKADTGLKNWYWKKNEQFENYLNYKK